MTTGGRIDFVDLLPEVFRADDAGRDFLLRFLGPFEDVFHQILEEVEGDGTGSGGGGLGDLFDFAESPPPPLRRWQASAERELFVYDCLRFLAAWVGLRLRPLSVRTVAWNRHFLQRAVPLLPWRGTLVGIDGLLRAWLEDDIVDPDPSTIDHPFVLVTDFTPKVNGGSSSFQLGETATLGVDTVLGAAAPWFLVVDLVTRPDVTILRHPVGVDALRLAALALLEDERPAHVHGELRIRGHTMQLVPAGDYDTWAKDAGSFARLGERAGEEPSGTALLWGDPWVVRFPDPTPGRTER